VKTVRMPRRVGQSLLVILLAFAGAAGVAVAQGVSVLPQGAAPAQAHAVDTAAVAPGDVLRIAVYGNPDLTTVTRVQPNGTITFPLVGEVTVGGETLPTAERRIAERLSRGGFVRNAQVSIFVQERSLAPASAVTLIGQVNRSGTYSLDPQSPEGVRSVISLLAKAGGPNDKAADHCYLIRDAGNGQAERIRVDLVELLRNGNVGADVPLQPGDVVMVPEMDVFYIYGEVQRPGRYKLERGMTVMQALSVASGMTPKGSVRGIELNRQDGNALKTIRSSLEARLQPDDVIYVRTALF
jgi:polysaccharide biosynthesis/export protein